MNFSKQAQKLEQFLDEELKSKVPLLPLKDGSTIYKTYRIKRNKNNNWDLAFYKGDKIDTFHLKVCAILAAKFHFGNQLKIYNVVKNLDLKYWTNSVDATIFNDRFKNSKDNLRKMTYIARWEITHNRAARYKKEIIGMFTRNFE